MQLAHKMPQARLSLGPALEPLRLGKAALAPLDARRARLRAINEYLVREVARFQEALATDLGRAPLDTKAELLMVKSEASFALKNLKRWAAPHRVGNTLMSQGTKAWIRYEPKGSVLVIAPWNAPFACSLVPMVGALAAGNSVVIKPSELAPASAQVIEDMIKALFPPEEVQVFQGDAATAKALLAQPFDHIYFTGSAKIGRQVMAAAAEHLTPVTLELGGKNPTIVHRSCRLKATAEKIAWGKGANAGQACVAPDHVLVDKSIAEPLVTALGEALTRMYNPDGRGFSKNPDLCRIISDHHVQRLQHLLDDALAKGARLAFGGQIDPADRLIEPTILTDVSEDMAIMHEEVFGPILPVMTFGSEDEALTQVRRRPKPLALYIFSEDKAATQRLLEGTTAGSTVINHNMIQAGVNSHLSFGGVGESGMGRSIGRASFESFSNARSVVEQPSGWGDTYWLSLPPYSGLFKRMINWLFQN